MAVVAPMPRARVMIAVSAKPGAFRSCRSASRISASMCSSEGRWCPDFLRRLVALIHSMRLSLMKGAHADLSNTAWQEIGVVASSKRDTQTLRRRFRGLPLVRHGNSGTGREVNPSDGRNTELLRRFSQDPNPPITGGLLLINYPAIHIFFVEDPCTTKRAVGSLAITFC